MVFCKARWGASQVKRNSPKYHEGIHMYLRQMEDYSRPVTLELEKTYLKEKKYFLYAT